MTSDGGCKFIYYAGNALPPHIQSTSISYSPLAFRFIARKFITYKKRCAGRRWGGQVIPLPFTSGSNYIVVMYFTGSFYDGLRVKTPDEFDLNLIFDLKLPKDKFKVSE